MMRSLQILVIALCMGLTACAKGKVYPQPAVELHEALGDVDELPPVFGSAAPDLSLETSDPSSVAWIVNVKGSELMRFVARLEPEGEASTRMTLDLVGPASGEHAAAVTKRLADHPEIKRFYLVAMTEQIDSTLEHRPFDITRTYGAMAAAAAANVGTMSGQMDEAGQANQSRGANDGTADAADAAGE